MEEEKLAERKELKELLFKYIVVVSSIVFTLFWIELGVGRYLSIEENKKSVKCREYSTEEFIGSRSFSLINGYYQPFDEVRHCDLEYDYVYHINGYGFREGQKSIQQSGVKEILAVGNSFTFGFGVKDNESFPALLDAYNSGLWGDPYDVQMKAFERNIELVKPKIVVWGIYPSHIITMMPGSWEEKCPGDAVYFRGAGKVSAFFRNFIVRPITWLANNSAMGRFILGRKDIKKFEVMFDGLYSKKNCYQTKEVLLYDENLADNRYTSQYEVNLTFLPQRDEVYELVGRYFKEAKRISEEYGTKVYFLLIPSRMQLKLKLGIYEVKYEGADIDPDLPVKMFSEIITEAGFSEDRIVDLSKYFLEVDDWTRYYYKIDAHWNKEGHKFVADIVKDIIIDGASEGE